MRGPHHSTHVPQITEPHSCPCGRGEPSVAFAHTWGHAAARASSQTWSGRLHRAPSSSAGSRGPRKTSWFCRGKSILQPLPATLRALLLSLPPSCTARPISRLVAQVFVINFSLRCQAWPRQRTNRSSWSMTHLAALTASSPIAGICHRLRSPRRAPCHAHAPGRPCRARRSTAGMAQHGELAPQGRASGRAGGAAQPWATPRC